MTCKDCIHERVCKNAYLFKVTPPNVCGFFKNKSDYVEVKHGVWVHRNGEMQCSECGGEALMDEVYYKSPYCPKCGAKMDGNNLSTIPTGSEGRDA